MFVAPPTVVCSGRVGEFLRRIRIINESHRGLAGGRRGGETISVLTAEVSVECAGWGWSCVRAEMVDGDGVASRAASALVTARLSSSSRTRSRTSRARLLKDLVGVGESRASI